MPASDFLYRLNLIGDEGPQQTLFEKIRSQRAQQKQALLQQLELERQRAIQFNATTPPQNQDSMSIIPGQGFLSQYPLRGKLRVTSPYGVSRKGHKHKHSGIDWAAPAGTSIFAPAGGVVRSTRWDKIYGNQTILDLGGGRSLMFGHQSGFGVKPGQRVNAGQLLGYVGSTGWSTGPHLHFETWINNQPVNPLSWFT